MALASANGNHVHPFETPEEYAGYRVLDVEGREIGTVGEVFKSADDGLDYVEVKTGFLNLQSVLILADLVAVDEEREALLLR